MTGRVADISDRLARPMKHAGATALDQIEDLPAALRAIGGFKEKSRGVFYRKSQAFLHFHEDPSGLHADISGRDGGFVRLRADSAPTPASSGGSSISTASGG
jgi:hypothetical protein